MDEADKQTANPGARVQPEAGPSARVEQLRSVLLKARRKLTAPLRHALAILRTGRRADNRPQHTIPAQSMSGPERERAGLIVRQARIRLLELGFHDLALADLKRMAGAVEAPFQRGLAAWELAQWHASQAGPEDAALCLDYLHLAAAQPLPEVNAQRIAVLKAESLARIGETGEARAVLEHELAHIDDLNLPLGLSRLETTLEARAGWINTALALRGLAPLGFVADGATPFDRLDADSAPETECPFTVSVIMPVFNAERTLGTALRSLLNQSWTRLEIIVSDDGSTDGTARLVEAFAAGDPRIRLIRGAANGGPYVARNLALREATGDFITCHDADDWSHPQKIARQVRHLLDHPDIVANSSQQVRADEDMCFTRRGLPGLYLQPNPSSVMFRREPVLREAGYWDCVRFGADTEFMDRLKRIFDQSALVHLDTGPLAFQRQSDASLTGSGTFGYPGFLMGARREYEHGFRRYHRASERAFIDFPLADRPFFAPAPMHPGHSGRPGSKRHFDVLMACDFRLPEAVWLPVWQGVLEICRQGHAVGVVQMPCYGVDPLEDIDPVVCSALDAGVVTLLVYGESASCDLLVLTPPGVLQDRPLHLPEIEARQVQVVIDEPLPLPDGGRAHRLDDLQAGLARLRHDFGTEGCWHPVSVKARAAFLAEHPHLPDTLVLGDSWISPG